MRDRQGPLRVGILTAQMGALDLSVLNSWYAGKSGTATSGSGGAASGSAPAPAPPWTVSATASKASTGSSVAASAQTSALAQSLLAGGKLIDPAAARLSAPGGGSQASANYRNLFALYQGLTGLQSIARAAEAPHLSTLQSRELQQGFQAGLQQVQSYLGGTPFKGFQIYQTAPEASGSSTLAVPQEADTYTTHTLYAGPPNGVVAAFQGPVQFSLTATRASGTQVTVSFDFTEMGGADRTFGNVLAYMNGKMADAGLATRFADTYTPGAPTTVTAGGKTIVLPAGPDQYALTIKGTSAEALSFQAPAADPAVYVAQTSGIASGGSPDAVQQLLKLDAADTPADPSAINGQVFKQSLGSAVSKAVATATAPDGSVYVLANVTGAVNGQAIQGAQDVALIKYDSAGNVVFTRTLGAPQSATGIGLAISADGSQVAIVGSTTDNLDLSNPGAASTTAGVGLVTTAPPPQGFVTVFDGAGNEQWTRQTQATGGQGGGVRPDAVAFGSGGMVYVAGQVDGSVTGGVPSGGQDAYVQAFHAVSQPLNDGSGGSQWVAAPTAAAQYGTSGQDHATGIAVSGSSVYVSSLENGDAVVRAFDPAALTQSAVRDLGAVQGGNVAGVAVAADGSVVVAGSTHNGSLDAGQVTQAYGGGEAVFVASLAPDLQAAAADRLTYLGGATDQSATALTLSGGQLYVAGQIATAPLAGSGQTTGFDGYVAAVDPQTGAVAWSQRYSGKENQAAPAGLAVAAGGASVLDQLGLPGAIDYAPSQQLVADSSLRPGDELFIQSGTGAPAAVKISASDTYQTLAQKIARASNFKVKATILPSSKGLTLKLAPAFQSGQVSLLPGPPGRDALAALGLSQGVLTTAASQETHLGPSGTTGPRPSRNALKNGYSLNLSSSLGLANPARATAAAAALSGAIATLKGVYSDMTNPPPQPASATSGSAPAYLTKEIAQYRAALSRLSGGG